MLEGQRYDYLSADNDQEAARVHLVLYGYSIKCQTMMLYVGNACATQLERRNKYLQ